ncbi:MAG TPA: hypothetical protein VFZ58_03235 [Candidatus Saccharimonadales bacterium]
MEHASQLVDILSPEGTVSHTKARQDVDKTKDTYHAIYVLLITPEKDILLNVIPTRKDLPNLYSSRYGTTVATIRRHGETADEAAERAVSRELFIEGAKPIRLGESFEVLPDGHKVLASAYYFQSETPDTYSSVDIGRLVAMTPKELDILVEADSEDLAPTLTMFWQKYRSKLPL